MKTTISKLTAVFTVTFALLIGGCTGLTDANLDEADDTQQVTIETSGDYGDGDTQNGDDTPRTWLPEPDVYDDDDEDVE